MDRPIVIAHHLIMTAYGWWLPNDPRGSTSRQVRNDVLADLGNLHFGRRRIQPPSAEIREFYERAGELLEFPLLEFADLEVIEVAGAFSEAIARRQYTCYACAILPDHVHLIVRKHKHQAEEMIENLQSESRSRLYAAGLRGPNHPAWARSGWKVFLDRPDDVRRTIEYIDGNPVKLGRQRQAWPFVKGYDGWPFHPGHSPRSPYVKRLRGREV